MLAKLKKIEFASGSKLFCCS